APRRPPPLGVGRPTLLKKARLPVAAGPERLRREVEVDAAGERVRDHERRRREIRRAHLRMDAALEVAIPGEDGRDDEVVILDGGADGVGQRTAISNASSAPVA